MKTPRAIETDLAEAHSHARSLDADTSDHSEIFIDEWAPLFYLNPQVVRQRRSHTYPSCDSPSANHKLRQLLLILPHTRLNQRHSLLVASVRMGSKIYHKATTTLPKISPQRRFFVIKTVVCGAGGSRLSGRGGGPSGGHCHRWGCLWVLLIAVGRGAAGDRAPRRRSRCQDVFR